MDLIVKKQLIKLQCSLKKKEQPPITELLLRKIFDYLLVLQCKITKNTIWGHSWKGAGFRIATEHLKTCFEYKTHINLMKISKDYERQSFRVITFDDKGKAIDIRHPTTDWNNRWLEKEYKDDDERKEKWTMIEEFENKKKELEKNYIFKN